MPVSEKKTRYAEHMNELLDTYNKVLFCDIDNVRSQQMHKVRRALRGRGVVLVGKKTLQKKILNLRADAEDATDTDKKLRECLCEKKMLVTNLAFVFTNEDVSVIKALLNEYRIQAPARVGAVAPSDVVVPAGNTGLEPTTTTFFQALNIPTKIAKGTVEITADKKVLSAGEKVDSSAATLLQKLKISPFFYAAEIRFFWERGLMFTAEDLAVTDDSIEAEFTKAISNLTAVSVASGILTEASLPHAVTDAFKTLLGASVESEYVFEEFDGKNLRENIKSGKCVSAAAAPAASAAVAAPAAPVAAAESSEDEGEMESLF